MAYVYATRICLMRMPYSHGTGICHMHMLCLNYFRKIHARRARMRRPHVLITHAELICQVLCVYLVQKQFIWIFKRPQVALTCRTSKVLPIVQQKYTYYGMKLLVIRYEFACQTNAKTIQNLIKITLNKASTFRPRGTNIEVWRPLQQVWMRLGPSWAIWAVSGSVLDRRGRDSGASWGVLVRKRWPTWLQAGSKNGANIDKTSIQKSINFLVPLEIPICMLFFNFWNQKLSHAGSKMHSKIDFILKNLKSCISLYHLYELNINYVSGVEKSIKH